MSSIQHIHFDKLPFEPVNDQVSRKMAVGQNAMILKHTVKKGFQSEINETHINEQFTYVLEGKLEVRAEERTSLLAKGDMLIIPPNKPHTLKALEDTIILDVFSPVRTEWL